MTSLSADERVCFVQEIESLSAQNVQLDSELEQARTEVARLTTALSQATDTIDHVQRQLADTQTQLDHCTQHIDQLVSGGIAVVQKEWDDERARLLHSMWQLQRHAGAPLPPLPVSIHTAVHRVLMYTLF